MLVKQRVLMSARVLWVAAIMVLGMATVTAVSSQSVSAAENTANTLKVSPVRSDIQIKPGESKTVQTVVTNLTKAPITVRAIQNDFISGDERGTPALILDESKYAPTHSLKRFMKPIADITIPAGQAKTVGVVITVPQNTQAGGYFGAVRFAPTSPDSGGQVNLNASVASLILLTVPGDIVEKLELADFAIQQDGTSGSFFQSSNDLQATVRFENKGGAQVGPFGKLSVMQGSQVVYEADFNNKDPRDMVLPDSARRWDIPLKKIGSFGNYTVTATFTYGEKNQTIEVTKSFWVVPQIVIIATIIGVLVLVLLIVGIVLLVRGRGYRRRSGFRRH